MRWAFQDKHNGYQLYFEIEVLLPLSCPLCDKQFLSSQIMHDHLKALHLVTSEARIVLLVKESKNY